MEQPRRAVSAALISLAASASFAGDSPEIRITTPGPGEILYGPTRIVAETTAGARSHVARVLFYLDPVEAPICQDTEAPFTCEFDAGAGFQGRKIRVRALDDRGRTLGEDTLETVAFPEAEQVVERIIRVPVVAAKDEGKLLDLQSTDLTCSYAGEVCEILDFETLVSKVNLPLSILVLVDVSGSVTADREELLAAVDAVIDRFPEQGKVALAEFCGDYRRLGPFTNDRREIKQQVARLASHGMHTCLLQALAHGITTLGAREGHRVLFLISDGEETCDVDVDYRHQSGSWQSNIEAEAMAHVIELSRSVAVPVYVYRLEKVRRPGYMFISDLAHEGLARETGGRLFGTGDLYGIGRSFGDLIDDLETTWMVDIALPRGIPPGRPQRLVLEMPGRVRPALRYPEYWDPRSFEMSKIRFLRSDSAEDRYWAAKGLENSRTADALRELLAAARRETHDLAREAELDSVVAIASELLLHGDTLDQKSALAAMVTIQKTEPKALLPLQPALAVYQKTGAPRRFKKKAGALLARAEKERDDPEDRTEGLAAPLAGAGRLPEDGEARAHQEEGQRVVGEGRSGGRRSGDYSAGGEDLSEGAVKKWAPAPFPIVAPTVSPVPTAKVEESEPEALERLLARLVRVGSLYRNFALEFECRESVTYTIFGKETRGKRFAYLFVNEGEQGSPREYRLTRRQVNKETTLEEANPRDFGIDLFLENAYLFTEVFGEPRQPFYRFSLDGAEEVLGRQAMRLFVEPRPPMRSRLNDWVGWFWIDSETSQILRVEAYHAESAVAWTDLQADLVRAKESEAEFYREHVTEKVTVEFGVERNGMRFPSRAEILKERYGVRGGRVARNEKGRKVARTTQHYEDYRFFAIKTVEEIRAYVEAGSE